MKNLLLFEGFNQYEKYLADKKIKWPDAIFWIDKLYPEEICYLVLFADKNGSFIPFHCSTKDNSVDIEEDRDSFELYYEIPSKDGYATFSFDVTAEVSYTKYYPATYYDPEEGGDTILNDVDVENPYFLDAEEENEVFLGDPNKYQYKSEFVKKEDLINLMIEAAEEKISFYDSNVKSKKVELYQGLIDKCEKIRSENNFGSKTTGIIRRFIQ